MRCCLVTLLFFLMVAAPGWSQQSSAHNNLRANGFTFRRTTANKNSFGFFSDAIPVRLLRSPLFGSSRFGSVLFPLNPFRINERPLFFNRGVFDRRFLDRDVNQQLFRNESDSFYGYPALYSYPLDYSVQPQSSSGFYPAKYYDGMQYYSPDYDPIKAKQEKQSEQSQSGHEPPSSGQSNSGETTEEQIPAQNSSQQ